MKAKKKVFVVAIAVCLVAILSLSSLAWFSDADEVTNKFMISSSDDPEDPDDIFSVDIWEIVDDIDGDGQPDKIAIGDSTTGKTYEHIYPSQTLVKTPTVENTGKYDQWIRVSVTLTEASAWAQICQELTPAGEPLFDLTTIFKGHDSTNVWTRGEIISDIVGDTITYVYYLDYKLEPDQTVALFQEIVLPSALDQEQMATLDGGFEMTLVAQAVQADNTGATAQEAFSLVMGS